MSPRAETQTVGFAPPQNFGAMGVKGSRTSTINFLIGIRWAEHAADVVVCKEGMTCDRIGVLQCPTEKGGNGSVKSKRLIDCMADKDLLFQEVRLFRVFVSPLNNFVEHVGCRMSCRIGGRYDEEE